METISRKPVVDENEISRRRRAVYCALQPYMRSERLAAALWVWERNYNRGAAFQLADYVREVCTTAELQGAQSEIRRRLVTHMGMRLEQLGPDPWPLMREYTTPADETVLTGAGKRDEATVVFTAILTKFFDRMQDAGPTFCSRIRDLLVDRLSRSNLHPVTLAELSGWLATGAPMSDVRLSVESMRRIVNLVYIDACEYFGPTVADHLLAEAARETEKLPEAREFPPRQLL
jgi:hypothetical protein